MPAMNTAPARAPEPRRQLLVAALAFAASHALAQPAAPSTVRIRGTMEAVDGASITVKDRRGGVVTLVLTDKVSISEAYPIALSDIRPGSYIGTAAVPNGDGSLRALGVTVLRITAGRNGFTAPY